MNVTGTASTGYVKRPEPQPPTLPPGASFTPSPAKLVRFSNGESMNLNRKLRRLNKIVLKKR